MVERVVASMIIYKRFTKVIITGAKAEFLDAYEIVSVLKTIQLFVDLAIDPTAEQLLHRLWKEQNSCQCPSCPDLKRSSLNGR